MAYFIAFLTGAGFTLLETVTKYDKAPRFALQNIWFVTFFFLTGFAALSMFHLLKDNPRFTFGAEDAVVRAVIIGLEWQILLRSKLFSMHDPVSKQTHSFGLDFVYKKTAHFFGLQIDRHEEAQMLQEFDRIINKGKLSLIEIRVSAVNYISYRQGRGKMSDAEAASLIKFIKKSDAHTILYTIFDMAGLTLLRSRFLDNPRIEDPITI